MNPPDIRTALMRNTRAFAMKKRSFAPRIPDRIAAIDRGSGT
ncbi:hypothetical protein [Burkholderia cepacia]|nr:hypothetical protein [Burkholderia cepacia]